MEINFDKLKSVIKDIEEEKGDGMEAWSALCMWLAQYEAAQHSAHPTLLPARRKLVSCPQCKLMFGVDLPVSQSG